MICHHSRVLIVGAGIAGLACYIALKQKGINADIIEHHPRLRKGNGGLLLTSNAVEAAKELGIYSPLKKHAFSVSNINYHDEKNRPLMCFTKEEHFPDSAEFFSLHRNLLLTSLAQRVPNDTIEFNRSIESISTVGKESTVTLSNGETRTYELIIGADGIHSKVRSESFDKYRFFESNLSCIRLVMPKPKQLSEATYFIGKGAAVSLLPIDDDLVYCPFVFSDSLITDDHNLAPIDILNKLYGDFKGLLPEILASIDETVEVSPVASFNSLKMDSWITNNMVLIGDAAHALMPTQPQGAAMALEDATILAESLFTASDIPSALKQYQRRRFKRVKSVQTTGEKRVKAMKMSQNFVGKAIINKAMKLNGKTQFKKDWAPLILKPA